MYGTQYMVVNGVETRLILPIDVGRGQVGTSNF